MKIPKYWARATAESVLPRGAGTARFSCWRSSDASEAVAHQAALAAARRILDASLRGKRLDRYEYGSVPMREELLDEIPGAGGRLLAVLTRNLYGAVILNTERVMFIDIDFPHTANDAGKSLFKGLFGKKHKSPDDEKEERARQAVDYFIEDNPSWGMRLYRTFAGLRAIATHDIMEPSLAALDVLKQLGSDPLYIKLCKAQECFRARLTPKPWRCGVKPNPPRFPITDQKLQLWYERWKEDYESRHAPFATCRFIAALGNPFVHPEVLNVVELHDRITRATETLPLA